MKNLYKSAMMIGLTAALGACGVGDSLSGGSGLFGGKSTTKTAAVTEVEVGSQTVVIEQSNNAGRRNDSNITLEVNKYIWEASLDVLNFLPIETVDPFSGVIVTGYGTPPGGGRSYRATVYVQDPALDARSLSVALATRGGTVSDETTRAVEDAILTRARQLRISDSKL